MAKLNMSVEMESSIIEKTITEYLVNLDFSKGPQNDALIKNLTKHTSEVSEKLIKNMMLNPHERQMWFNHPNSDSGFIYDLISNLLTEIALDPKWIEFQKQYIEKHYQAHLEKALDRAMEHAANKQAFKKR